MEQLNLFKTIFFLFLMSSLSGISSNVIMPVGLLELKIMFYRVLGFVLHFSFSHPGFLIFLYCQVLTRPKPA